MAAWYDEPPEALILLHGMVDFDGSRSRLFLERRLSLGVQKFQVGAILTATSENADRKRGNRQRGQSATNPLRHLHAISIFSPVR